MLFINKSTVMPATYFARLGESVRTHAIGCSFCLQLVHSGVHRFNALDICTECLLILCLLILSHIC